jgi:hypothetical protein
MLKTFISIIAEVGDQISERKKPGEREKEYDGGLGQPYSQHKWAENYYGEQFSNTVLKKDDEHL